MNMVREMASATARGEVDGGVGDVRLAPYAFLPAALRRDLWREGGDEHEDDGEDGDNQSLAVAEARRTRSARLVSTLLYCEGNQENHDGRDTDAAAAPSRKAHARTKSKAASSAATAPAPAKTAKKAIAADPSSVEETKAALTPPLYSMAVELALSKRMAFANGVRQLDAYVDGILARVAELHARDGDDAACVPPWLWDSTLRLPTMLQIQRKIVQTVATCLPDCDVYLAMHEPLPMANPTAATPWPLLRYVAASLQSTMEGRVLRRDPPTPEEGASISSPVAASFAVLASLDPLLIQDVGDATSAASVRWLGHIDDQAVMTGPFACLPLVDARDSRAIGVLALDACRKAAQMRSEAMTPQGLYEFLVRMQLKEAAIEFRKLRFGGRQLLQLTANDLQHRPAYRTLKIQTKQRVMEILSGLRSGLPLHLPQGQRPVFFCDDDEALAFLDDVCERTGKFMDEYSRSVHWHRVMAKRTKDPKTTALDIYAVLLYGSTQALTGVERVCIWKIRDYADIDAIATSQPPDDRLMPFLEWDERQIRRLPLYVENNEQLGQLMQGNITRINLPSPPSQSGELITPSRPCERALYHVTWSNRTQQSLSWQQLRLILPIRPMNARHYQLSQLLKHLQLRRSEVESPGQSVHPSLLHFRLTDPNALIAVLKDPHRPDDVCYALEVDFLPQTEDNVRVDAEAVLAEQFIRRGLAITQENLACVRGREARAKRRLQSTTTTTQKFSAFGLTPSADAQRALDEIVAFMFQEISSNLPGTQQQVAELRPDGAQLRFTYAGNGSTLEGCALNRGQGVSFRCIDSRAPLVVGHQSELRGRLKLVGNRTGELETDLPYVFLPLLYEDACIGVLSVNRFVDVPKGRFDESHPEEGVVDYLMSLAKTLAAAIYLKRRAFALHNFQHLRLEPLRSPEQLFLGATRTLQDVMIGVWKIRVLEIDFVRGKSTTVYEYSETARQQSEGVLARQVIPLGYRVRELLPDTIANHWAITHEDVDSLLKVWRQHEFDSELVCDKMMNQNKEMNEVEKRKAWEWRVRRRYYELELKPLEDDPRCMETKASPASSSMQVDKASLARAQNHKYVAQVVGASIGSKTVAYAGIEALNIGNSSACYLAVAVQPQFFAACEQNFVNRLVESLSRMTESLVQRIQRSRHRVDSLDKVTLQCSSFVGKAHASLNGKPDKFGRFPLSPGEEVRLEGLLDLFDCIVRFVSSILECPCVYIALHEPFHRRLCYVVASPKSSMEGKILHRGHGLSFHTLDHQEPIVITAASQAQVEQLCGYGAKLRRFSAEPADSDTWPFIVVPIGSFGVLALDNLGKLERLTNESQPEFGIVDFLRRAALTVASAVDSVREMSRVCRRQRREDAMVQVMAACEDRGKHTTPLYLQHVVLQAIESAFNGVDAYIGIIQPMCSSLLFTSATSRSGMLNQHVNTTDSVSFRVFLSQRLLVIPQVERKQFDVSESPLAQTIRQLRWFSPSQDQGRKGPFVCIPIPFVGVLSVDTFPGATGGVYSPNVPEYGVTEALTTMANLLGQSIREMNATVTKREIPKLFEGNRSSFRSVFTRLLQLIAKNVLAAVELSVVCYRHSPWTPVHGVDAPLVSVQTPVEQHRNGHSTNIKLAPLISEVLRMNRDGDGRSVGLIDHPEVIILRCLDIRDVDSIADGAVGWQESCQSLTTAIVIRRVRGATWSYDEEFVLDLLPLIDEVTTLVNVRVCGITSRRIAMRTLEAMCTELESTPSSEKAFKEIPHFVDTALNVIVQASSEIPGDAYMAQRTIGGDLLEFIAASEASLMRGVRIDLLAADNQDLVTVTCLQRQRHLIVHLTNGKNTQMLRSLTAKKVQRVFAVFPMSEERLLCIDSLSPVAFDSIHARLETDVVSFLTDCASLLEETIATVRHRYAYDQLCDLKPKRHANLRQFFATIHAILRREINESHSQQVMELADDFTGHFSVRSWHHFAARIPIRGLVPPHFCFVNGCIEDLTTQDIHFDVQTVLPMTNVPRTLDQSRATMEPTVGREKYGAYACDCLSTMVDSGLEVSAKLALCVYSYDGVVGGSKTLDPSSAPRRTTFTSRQRQFFFALSAVASDVYTHVFRACVLDTYGVESLFIARDRLNAKDAVLLAVAQSNDSDLNASVSVVSACSLASTKWIPGSAIAGKLMEKTLAFHSQWMEFRTVDFVVHVSKTTTAARTRNATSKAEQVTSVVSTVSLPNTKVEATQPKQSFFRRPRLFGAKEKPSPAPVARQAVTAEIAPPPQPPPPTAEFHILLRGHHDSEVLSLTVEREIGELEETHEQIASEVRKLLDEISTRRSAFLSNPRGDEEWNGVEFGHVPEIGEGKGFGGGGFHVLSCWAHWRDLLRDQIVFFETDMRGYLTGVQATSREQLSALVASNLRPGLLPSGAASSPHIPIFSRERSSTRTVAIVLVRAALVLCGYKKEVALDSPSEKDDDLLKEYLRANAGRKLVDLNPRTTAKWTVALRASNYIKANFATIATLMELDSEAERATRTLFVFISAFASAVKYFKFLQDGAKQRKLFIDRLATRIQCMYRVVLAKKLLKKLKIEFSAAVSIQCAFRQHLARRRRAFLKWDRAARTVQKAYRRKLAQRRGRRPRKLTVELRTVAAQYGTMQATRLGDPAAADESDGAWKVEMTAFDSFKSYLDSRVGREQLKREERVIAERLKEVARQRDQVMTPHDRLLADAYDIFELLDIEGSGELSRERTQELMLRLHIPLSSEEAADVIDMMDNDRSGAISFTEFTNWFSHEYEVLKKRSRECGVLSRRDRQWIADESARSALRKRWRAHQAGATSLTQKAFPVQEEAGAASAAIE